MSKKNEVLRVWTSDCICVDPWVQAGMGENCKANFALVYHFCRLRSLWTTLSTLVTEEWKMLYASSYRWCAVGSTALKERAEQSQTVFLAIADAEGAGCSPTGPQRCFLCKLCMLFLWKFSHFLGDLGSDFVKMYWTIETAKEVMYSGQTILAQILHISHSLLGMFSWYFRQSFETSRENKQSL